MISETVKKQNKTPRKFWNRMLLLARVKVCKYLFFMRKKISGCCDRKYPGNSNLK